MVSSFRRQNNLFAILLSCLILSGCTAAKEPPSTTPQAAPAPSASVEVAPLPGPYDWSDAIVYFAIVDRFADGDPGNNTAVDVSAKGTFHGGDLKGLIQHLDEISGLGVTALWLTPLVKNIDGFVTGAGFPDWGYHGYWADDFYSLDPRFGTEDDLKKLVAECHKRGIRVLLDVVYNHAGYDSQYAKDPKTKGWLRTESLGTCGTDDLTSCLSGLPDFKTEMPEVAEYLLGAHLGLAKRTGLDGFRLDTVKHVDHPFWQEHRKRTREQLGSEFFLLGEVWGGDPVVLDPWFSGDEMDAGFDFSFQGSALGFLMGRGRAVAFDRYLKSREKIRAGYHVSHFLSSHDVTGALHQLQGDRQLFRLAAVLQFTSVGIPTIYYGEEVGRAGGEWPENRSDMPWGERNVRPGNGQPRDEALREDYRKLIAIRKKHPALSRGTHTGLFSEGDLLVFSRTDAVSGDSVVVAVNRGKAAAKATVPAPPGWDQQQLLDAWSGEKLQSSGGNLDLTLEPGTARIITRE